MSRRGAAMVLGGLSLATVGYVYGTDPRATSLGQPAALNSAPVSAPFQQKGMPLVLPPAVTGSAGPAVLPPRPPPPQPATATTVEPARPLPAQSGPAQTTSPWLRPIPPAPEVIAPIVKDTGNGARVPAIAPKAPALNGPPVASPPVVRQPSAPSAPQQQERSPPRQPTRLATPNPSKVITRAQQQQQQTERRSTRFEMTSSVLPRAAPGPKTQPAPRVVNH